LRRGGPDCQWEEVFLSFSATRRGKKGRKGGREIFSTFAKGGAGMLMSVSQDRRKETIPKNPTREKRGQHEAIGEKTGIEVFVEDGEQTRGEREKKKRLSSIYVPGKQRARNNATRGGRGKKEVSVSRAGEKRGDPKPAEPKRS